MNESRAKINYVGGFSRLKIHSLALQREKRTRSNWRSKRCMFVCRNTLTDHGSILAVNKFYACTNLVKFIFKSFVSCNLQFQAFYVRNSTFRARKKPCPGQVDFLFGQETFSPSLPDGQGPRQAVRRLNF